MAGPDDIDRLCAEQKLSALIGITTNVAPLIDLMGSGRSPPTYIRSVREMPRFDALKRND